MRNNLLVIVFMFGILTMSGIQFIFASAQVQQNNTPDDITIDPSVNIGSMNNESLSNEENLSPTNASTILLVNGTIKAAPLLSKAIISQVNLTITDAAEVAERFLGPGSHITSLSLGIRNGFLVYIVRGLDIQYNAHNIWIDAGTGKVLLSTILQTDTPIFDQ